MENSILIKNKFSIDNKTLDSSMYNFTSVR